MRVQQSGLPERAAGKRGRHVGIIDCQQAPRSHHFQHALRARDVQDAIVIALGANVAHVAIHTATIGRHGVQHVAVGRDKQRRALGNAQHSAARHGAADGGLQAIDATVFTQ